MKIVLFGTGPFAVPSFEALLKSSHEVPALVTRPIIDSGKRRKSAENPARDLAQRFGLLILDPVDANSPEFVGIVRELDADLYVVCDYGQVLSRECLGASKKGGINLHGSLLPRYRGAAPINWAIYYGEKVTGVTIIHMTAQLDGGPCLVNASLEIGSEETTAELEPRLSQLGVGPVMKAIEMLQTWDGSSPLGLMQDPQLATKAPRLKKTDGRIAWTRTALEIVNQIRAFQPWPGTFLFWPLENGTSSDRLIVHRARVVSEEQARRFEGSEFLPGQVVFNDGTQLWVRSGQGVIALHEVQPSGKRTMSIVDFLQGHRVPIGLQFD
jgi:methionyl-tRNA formyltransferase